MEGYPQVRLVTQILQNPLSDGHFDTRWYRLKRLFASWRIGPEDLLEEVSRSIRPLDLTPAVHADATLTKPEALRATDFLAALDAAAEDGRLTEHQAQVFETRRLCRIALLSRRDPSAVLGPGPGPPAAPSHLHHTRAGAAEAVTRYRDRYGPRRSGPGPHSALLGPDPGDCPEQPRRRR